MKNFIYTILFLFIGFSSLQLTAQRLSISDVATVYENIERTSIEVMMEPGPDLIKDQFSDWMKKELDVKLKGYGFLTNKDVLIAEKIKIPAISGKQMDFYVQVIEEGENSKMSVFASYGYDIHITPESHPVAYRSMKGVVLDFLDDFLPNWYMNRIEESREVVSDLENERSKLEEEIANNLNEIDELREEIDEKGDMLQETQSELIEAAGTLERRQEKLDQVNQKLDEVKNKESKSDKESYWLP